MTALFPIPASWAWTTLGEIAEVVGGVTKDTKKQSDPALPEMPYLRVANVQRGYLDLREITKIRVPESTLSKLRLLPGDVLLNEGGDRDKLGRGWVWDGQIPNCIHQNHVFRARLPKETVLPRFLAWYINYPARQWFDEHAAQSVNLASISLSTIKQLPVPVAPLDEQRRIVATLEDHLSHLDRALRTFSDLKLQVQSLRNSLLDSYFCNEAIRDQCPRVSLGSLGKVTTGSTPDSKNLDYWGGELPFVTPGDLSDGQRVSSVSRGLTKSGANSARVLNPGAILAVCIGATLGKVGWIDRNCAINQQINAIQPNQKLVDSEFVSYLLASPSLQRELWTRSSSTTLPILNKGRFEQIEIYLPSLEEQFKIVTIVRELESAIKRLKSQLANGLRRAENLRRSLLHEAFAGRLVPQQPTDTPASLLLERIRMEWDAQPKTGRGRMGPQRQGKRRRSYE